MITSCIQSVKDTKFKAIHNLCHSFSRLAQVVFNLSKIQNLKRFTTAEVLPKSDSSCIQSVKDTKFKAIHNVAQ